MKLVRPVLACSTCPICKGVNSWNCYRCPCSKAPPPRR